MGRSRLTSSHGAHFRDFVRHVCTVHAISAACGVCVLNMQLVQRALCVLYMQLVQRAVCVLYMQVQRVSCVYCSCK